MITIIGRGHSGTRVQSKMLYDSGVFMGDKLNKSSDKVLPQMMYQAARYINDKITYEGDYEWNISKLLNSEPDEKFITLIQAYLKDVITEQFRSNSPRDVGWKLPETTFTYPWLTKLYPDMKYIIWWRHPYDAVLSPHGSDKFEFYHVPGVNEKDMDISKRGAISWKYQYDIITKTPEPINCIHVKYEDFVIYPKKTMDKLEDFLGMKLVRPHVHTKSAYKWNKSENANKNCHFAFFDEPLEFLDYPIYDNLYEDPLLTRDDIIRRVK